MKKRSMLIAIGAFVLTSTAMAETKSIWSCEIGGGQSSLESAEIQLTNRGLIGSVMYNRPFDDEGVYDVKVSSKESLGKLEFSGSRPDGGSFSLSLEIQGQPESGDHAHGTLSGSIPAKADPTGFGAEKYTNHVDCVLK